MSRTRPIRNPFAAGKNRGKHGFDRRLAVEPLENRLVLSTISWTNRGLATDQFASTFGTNAGAARAVIDAVIDSWERVIVDFNYPGGGNTFNLNLSMDTTGTGHGGFGGVGTVSSNFQPTSGNVTLGRGNDTNFDGLGDGGGYFLDPTPLDWSEFWDIDNVFSATAPLGSPASGLADLFTLAAHEIGHALGFEGRTDLAIHSLSTATGIPDVTGHGHYYVFNGPSINHLNTSRNLNGQSPVTFVHSATDQANITYGGWNYRGADDLMNWSYGFSLRRLIPDTMALMFQDGYGYTIEMPQHFGTYHASLNQATGELLIRGGAGSSEDVIELWDSGGELTVSVDLGDDAPGTGVVPGPGDLSAFVSHFDTSSISSIRIQAGDGDDTVRIWTLPGGLSSVNVEGEAGDDTLDVGHATGNVANVDSNLSFDGGAGSDTLNYNDAVGDFPPPLTYGSYFSVIDRTSGPAAWYANTERVNLFGRGGGNTINIYNAGANLYVYAGAGNDVLQVDPGSPLFSLDSAVTVDGQGGEDALMVYDGDDQLASFTIDQNRISDDAGSTVLYYGLEEATLHAGPGPNLFLVEDTTAGTPLSINAGGGNDVFEIDPTTHIFTLDALLTVDGQDGFDQITVHDEGYGGDVEYFIDGHFVSDSFGNRVDYFHLEQATLNTGPGENVFFVEDTAEGAPFSINAGDGDDLFLIDPTTHIFTLPALLTIDGQNGTDELIVHDEGWSGDTTYGFDWNYVADSSGNRVDYVGLERAILNAGPGQNEFLIEGTAPGTPLTVNAGEGTDFFAINLASRIFGLNAPVDLHGQGGWDQLQVYDDAHSEPTNYELGPTWLVDSLGNHANYFSLEHVTLEAGAGNNMVLIPGTAEGTPVTVNLGDGDDVLQVLETFANAPVHVDGENGDDTVVVNLDDAGMAEVFFDSNQTLAELVIGAGGRATILPGNEVVLHTGLLHISSPAPGIFAGTLDITDGGVIVDYPTGSPSPIGYHAQQIRHARNAGSPTWSAAGITSSLAAADPQRLGIGFAEAQFVLPGGGSFMGGWLPPGEDAVLIRLALNGDANLDNVVDGQDFIAWNNYKFQSGTLWLKGDFNLDQMTDGQDFILWNLNKFTSYTPLAISVSNRWPTATHDSSGLAEGSEEDMASERQWLEAEWLYDAVFAELA